MWFVQIMFIFSSLLAQAQTPKVGNISPEDQQRVKARVQTLNMTSVAFGPAWGSDEIRNDNMFYSLHLGKHWEVNTNAEIRLNGDALFASKDSGSWFSASLGAGWLIFTDDFSPVVGAEFGYGYAHVSGVSDPSGFLFGGFAGVRFFRTATAQISLEGFLQTILDTNSPTVGGVRVGILF